MASKNWIQTYSGKVFDVLDINPDSILIEDIAHALSMNCRFNGHCLRFYSVAEHSLDCSKLLAYDRKLSLRALLHDGSEAYLTDVPKPIKPLISGYKEMEDKIQNAIYAKFGLDVDDDKADEQVGIVDVNMLMTEKLQNMNKCNEVWNFPDWVKPVDTTLRYYTSAEAKVEFLRRFYSLYEG